MNENWETIMRSRPSCMSFSIFRVSVCVNLILPAPNNLWLQIINDCEQCEKIKRNIAESVNHTNGSQP